MRKEFPQINLLRTIFHRKQDSLGVHVMPKEKSIKIMIAKVSTLCILEEISFESAIRNFRSDLRRSAVAAEKRMIFYDIQGGQEKLLDALRMCAQDVIFDEINAKVSDPQKRHAIKIACLQTVKHWWNSKLDNEDRAYDTIEIGRRRINQIDSQIHDLLNP